MLKKEAIQGMKKTINGADIVLEEATWCGNLATEIVERIGDFDEYFGPIDTETYDEIMEHAEMLRKIFKAMEEEAKALGGTFGKRF